MAAMIALYEPLGVGLPQIMLICVPATIMGVIAAALVQTRVGRELKDDPEYQRRLNAGELQPPGASKAQGEKKELPKGARLSAVMFLVGVALIVLAGLFPGLRPLVAKGDAAAPLGMADTIQIVMLSLAALMLLTTRTAAGKIPKTEVAQAGLTAVIGIFGLAWLGDTFIKGNEKVIIGAIGDVTSSYPITFALGLFFASVLLFSQAATTRALMPLGISLGIAPPHLVAMWPAVNGYFFLPTYGSLIAAINFDRTGTTRIGRYVLNHSFMLPGLVATAVAILAGLVISGIFL
jgi:anaerobic C4-dicarboxylate transporter DcuA